MNTLSNQSSQKPWSFSPEQRLFWIYRIILLGLGAQMLLSWPLWWAPNGVLPYLPVISFAEPWIASSSLILFPVFLLLIFGGLVFPKKDIFLKFLLVVGIFLVLGNIHRLQVWFYFYGILLFLFLWRKKLFAESLLWTIRVVVTGIYVWSGLHKLNIHFVEDIFPWLMEPLGWSFSPWLAYAAGGVEVLIGLGLLFRITQKNSIIGCFLFHGIILGLLGPLGHNWNMVVWPWNLVMPLLVFFLFSNKDEIDFKNSRSFLQAFRPGLLVISLVWILPAFNYLGFTPEQLSFKMYAGSQPEVVLYFGEKDRNLVGDHPTTYGVLHFKTLPSHRLVLDDLAFAEWGTPLFTTQWTARKVANQFCDKMQRPDQGGILYLVDDDFIRMPCASE